MNASFSKGLLIALLIIQGMFSYGQNVGSKYQLGATAGMFIYQGDLAPSRFGSFKTAGIQGQLFVTRILTPSFALRGNLSFGRISGDDSKYETPAWRQERNFNFSSPLIELSAMMVYYPLSNDRLLSPYFSGGAGLSWLSISRDASRFNAEFFTGEPNLHNGLVVDANHKPPRFLPVVPVGAGIQFILSKKISLMAESSYRLTASDYIDGFSKSANPDKFDHYQNYSLGVVFKFGKTKDIDCPVIRQ